MNSKKYSLFKAALMILLFISICSFSCTKKQSPPATAYVGTWHTKQANLKVRVKTGVLKYAFKPVEIPVTLTIHLEGKVSVTIGAVKLDKLSLEPNKGNSSKTGISYLIVCGELGKLNANDPLAKKKLELWIKPLGKGNELQIEVRQMETLDAFPMGELRLFKQ